METHLADFIRNTPAGIEADRILRACVHCGFCTATCPTYQLLGDELDGPRGRIYLIKETLEGGAVSAKTRLHLDRCLTCRACETTCPSGVEYGRLIEIGRHVVKERVAAPRPWPERGLRALLRFALTRRWLFDPAMAAGQALRHWLPAALKAKVPQARASGHWPKQRHAERMLLLEGCVQPAMIGNINKATARVLDALDISLVRVAAAGCCGAIKLHLDDTEGAKADARRNIDAWLPYLESGVSTIVMNASGCGVMVSDYGWLLQDDAHYAMAAARVAAASRDLSEVLTDRLPRLRAKLTHPPAGPFAFHAPCTLQHGLKLKGRVESLMAALGITLVLPRDAHLCCGSAGTYSVLQPELSGRLRTDKLEKLGATGAGYILSANIGCITHLQSATDQPVRHWVEMIDGALSRAPGRDAV